MLLKPTFELHLQHLILIVNDVTVWFECVAGAVHTDFQTQITSWSQTVEKKPKLTVSLFKIQRLLAHFSEVKHGLTIQINHRF